MKAHGTQKFGKRQTCWARWELRVGEKIREKKEQNANVKFCFMYSSSNDETKSIWDITVSSLKAKKHDDSQSKQNLNITYKIFM